jgi:hypothetical protein
MGEAGRRDPLQVSPQRGLFIGLLDRGLRSEGIDTAAGAGNGLGVHLFAADPLMALPGAVLQLIALTLLFADEVGTAEVQEFTVQISQGGLIAGQILSHLHGLPGLGRSAECRAGVMSGRWA